MKTIEACNILNISLEQANELKQVKRAYRQLSRLHHPDKGGDCQVMVQINQAYRHLIEQESICAAKEKSVVFTTSQRVVSNLFTVIVANYLSLFAYSFGFDPRS